jgi:curli production assembly/transport component CsgF
VIGALALPAGAAAGDLVYQPRNPSFGGNPFNSDHLLGLAERQNQFRDNGGGRAIDTDRSRTEELVRRLESRISSAIAEQAADAILGNTDDPQDSGRIQFGDQVIEFDRGTEQLVLTILDQATGEATEISLPILQVN